MFEGLKRRWKYYVARSDKRFGERADPAVQLEQAIAEAQDQHRRLKEQAASVIAQQKQNEMRLNRALAELEKVNGNARQAVLMAEDAAVKGDPAKASEYTRAAETFAGRLVSIDREVEDLKSMHYQSTQAADQAKAAVSTNAQLLQQKLSEKQKLVGQLEQAKMQEQMNTAMASLSETVGQDVPTFDEVRGKIEARYAKAKGMSELTESSVETRMFEIERAAMNTEAQTRLAEIRSQLGLGSGDQAPGALGEGDGTTESAAAPVSEPSEAPER
jgi:phage shock protein A